jgi:hypothetical protein
MKVKHCTFDACGVEIGASNWSRLRIVDLSTDDGQSLLTEYRRTQKIKAIRAIVGTGLWQEPPCTASLDTLTQALEILRLGEGVE